MIPSALLHSSRAIRTASGFFISSAIDVRLRLSGSRGSMKPPGRSMRITSAPWSASIMPQKGPGPMPANSMILMPLSGPAMMLSCSSDTFDDDRGRHAAGGAHGDEAIAAARAFEFVERGADQDRSRRADRMAECHRAAVDVHLLSGQVEVADELLGDDREGFVDFPDVDVFLGEAGLLEHLLCGRDRGVEHQRR